MPDHAVTLHPKIVSSSLFFLPGTKGSPIGLARVLVLCTSWSTETIPIWPVADSAPKLPRVEILHLGCGMWDVRD